MRTISTSLNLTVNDTMRGDRSRGEFSFSSNKRLSFTDTTSLALTYRITPNTLEADACSTHCTTCDYRIRVIVHDVENPDSTKEYPLVIGADDCPENQMREITANITVPPGTYIIERRMEANTLDSTAINEENPYGTTYARAFREKVIGIMDAQIRANDTIQEAFRLLGVADFDSLYSYLGVDPTITSKKIIHTECCAVEIPIVDPNCGFNPCRDSVPDFEMHLIDRWKTKFTIGGDTLNLNNYFKFDGGNKYPNTSLVFPNGRGAFNFMVRKMLKERRPDSSYVYDCATLWNIWDGLVGSFDRLARVDTGSTAYRSDFDLLETFLDAAGHIYSDTSTIAYDTTRGYLLYAYKRVNYTIGSSPNCQTGTGYNSGWHGNADSSRRWQALNFCLTGEKRVNSDIDDDLYDCLANGTASERDTCQLRMKAQAESDCRTSCDTKFWDFHGRIIAAYASIGKTVLDEEAYCMAQTMVDSCRNGCELSVFYGLGGHINGVGTPAEWAAMEKVRRYTAEVSVPDTVGGSLVCSNDSMTLFTGWKQPRTRMIVDHLNQKLEEFRGGILNTSEGEYWNFKSALREVAPSYIADSLVDSVVVVSPAIGSEFTLDGCALQYKSDSTYLPGFQHPMVGFLNDFLNTLWGYPISALVDDTATLRYTSEFYADTEPLTLAGYGPISSARMDSISLSSPLIRDFMAREFHFINGMSGQQSVGSILDLDITHLYGLQSEPDGAYGFSGVLGIGTDSRHYDSCYSGMVLLPGCPAGRDQIQFQIVTSAGSIGPGSPDTLYQVAMRYGVINTRSPVLTVNFNFINAFADSNRQMIRRYGAAPFTENIGEYGQDTEGYLTYHFKSSMIDTVMRMHGIRFGLFGSSAVTLHENICDTLVCPAVCLQWVEPDTIPVDRVDVLFPEPCAETAARQIRDGINASIARCLAEQTAHLEREYLSQCVNSDNIDDTLIISYPIDYYHFTVYTYDRAGNLVRTAPPRGINLSPYTTRMSGLWHRLSTQYEYNSLGQLTKSFTPDGDSSWVWYDQWGRPRFSQERRQADSGVYAYVKYDALGRVTESGTSSLEISGRAFVSRANDPGFPGGGQDRSYIVYGGSSGMNYLDGAPQKNLRNRISHTYNDAGARTYYSYDEHGNLSWLSQEIPGFPVVNFLKYEYELVSGNLLKTVYNEGRSDAFHHQYVYDADNRVVEVKTSRDGYIWDRDARYGYHTMGSLARREIGEDSLQGLDYTYTLQGWLKAVNHPSLDAANDPGSDGAGSGYPADSFAVELGYYKGDYVRSGSTLDSSASTGLPGAPLYGGNISSATAHIGKKTGARYEQLAGEVYRYDQLQRLTASDFRFYNAGTWNTTTQYATRYAYNADGDIDTLTRRAFDTMGSNKMDSIVFRYQGGGSPDNHKLIRVEDAVTGDKYAEDIGPGQTGMNYRYDRSGNLIRDEQEKMSLFWDASGKLERVERRPANNRWTIAEYTYDAGGNRVRRVLREKASNADVQVRTTFYVYDAAGTVVSIYEKNCTEPSDIDGDGVLNANDNCMYTWNPGQTDSDGDGVGDECDLCPGVPNPDNADADRDGIGDACDNCMYYNPDQADLNGNGIGDVCDAQYAGIDTDGDGMVDRVDPCPNYYNGPVWLDGDGDGIPDDCDNCPSVSNPNQKDEDHDGVGDECETAGGGGCSFVLVEQPIYGIIREGVSLPQDVVIGSLGPDTVYTRRLGEKLYELTDHLGNVRGVVSDRLLSDIVSGAPGKYRADMRRYSNLYPYGMEMPGRYYAGDGYRYGYNGMEQDSSSTGDHYTTYYRQYDARLGRFWSLDPVTHSWESPYAAMGGNPVAMVDPLGSSTGKANEDVKQMGGIGDDQRGGSDGGKEKAPAGEPGSPVVRGNEKQGDFSSDGKYVFVGPGDSKKGMWMPVQSEAEMNRFYDVIKDVVAAARTQGHYVPAYNLERWLLGEGGEKSEDPAWLLMQPSFKSAVEKNSNRFLYESNSKGASLANMIEDFEDGGVNYFNDNWSARVQPDLLNAADVGMFYAYGASQVKSSGRFKAQRINDTTIVLGTIKHSWTDKYNWDPGKKAPLPSNLPAFVPGVPKFVLALKGIRDEQMLLLEVYKGARPFIGRAEITELIYIAYVDGEIVNLRKNYLY